MQHLKLFENFKNAKTIRDLIGDSLRKFQKCTLEILGFVEKISAIPLNIVRISIAVFGKESLRIVNAGVNINASPIPDNARMSIRFPGWICARISSFKIEASCMLRCNEVLERIVRSVIFCIGFIPRTSFLAEVHYQIQSVFHLA